MNLGERIKGSIKNLSTKIFGRTERVTEDTPTGYRSYTKQVEPNIFQRVGGLATKIKPREMMKKFTEGETITFENPNYKKETPLPSPTTTPSPSQPRMKMEKAKVRTISAETAVNPPAEISQIIQEEFGEDAPNAYRVLSHPMESTAIGDEVQRGVNTGPNRGENPTFGVGIEMDMANDDGSIDRGLFRINNRTFADYQRRFPNTLRKSGINSWDDMLDPRLNARMAKIMVEKEGNYRSWYAAPSDLRQ